MIDDASFTTIREQGKRRGYVTVDDLRSALRIDQLSADELALIVVQLEEAGVPVELDEELMGASRRRTVTPNGAPAIDLPGAPSAKLDVTRPAAAPGVTQGAYEPAEPVDDAGPGAKGGVFVAVAAALVALGALILFYVSR